MNGRICEHVTERKKCLRILVSAWPTNNMLSIELQYKSDAVPPYRRLRWRSLTRGLIWNWHVPIVFAWLMTMFLFCVFSSLVSGLLSFFFNFLAILQYLCAYFAIFVSLCRSPLRLSMLCSKRMRVFFCRFKLFFCKIKMLYFLCCVNMWYECFT